MKLRCISNVYLFTTAERKYDSQIDQHKSPTYVSRIMV